jgi:endonuclease/exonuclease/phosphatase (EEP) superfamily protein YafD
MSRVRSFVRRTLSALRGSGPAPLTITCRCGKSISVAAEHRGKRIKCKQCGRVLRVHGASRFAGFGTPLTLLSWAYLAVIGFLTVALWGFGDVWWPATVLLFIGRWVFLLPLIALVPAALMRRRVLLVPLALAAVMCMGPLMGFRLGWRRLLPHAAGTHVRVLTFNTDGGDVLAVRLLAVLEQWRPDVVALQECGPVLADVVRNVPGWFHHQVRGLCFLSRYPLLDSLVMDRQALEQLQESEAGIGGSGDVARYTVQMPQGAVNVTNVHLETPRKGLDGLLNGTFSVSRLRNNTELRLAEAELARRWVSASTAPAIVAGDFNTPVESRIFQRVWGDLTDAFSRAGLGFGMTRQNGWIRVRIDHVLTGKGWYADHAVVGPDLGSDHLPVIVDLTLVPPA